MGILANLQILIHEDRSLQDVIQLKDYNIDRNATIIINLRLRGGAPRMSNPYGSTSSARNPKGPASFKDVVKGKVATTYRQSPNLSILAPYLVEQMEKAPDMSVNLSEVSGLFIALQTTNLICRFNGFWPKSKDLHQWIFTNWTNKCDICLCSKRFFVVQFDKQEDLDFVLKKGPWFWGRVSLFITPWFHRLMLQQWWL